MIGTLPLTLGPVPAMAKPSLPGATPNALTGGVRVEAESSFSLVRRAHDGDVAAREELCARYLPRLQRWAHGRLPKSARGALDTVDLVQDTFIQVLQRLDRFEARHPGGFQGYLCTTLNNRVTDEIRRVTRRGLVQPLDAERPALQPSPLEEAIGQEALERYEAAMARLRPEDRQAIVAKVEMALPYSEITALLGKPSVAAAQMAVSRALVRLAKEMAVERGK